MKTFRTTNYILKMSGFWDRMKSQEDGVKPWSPQDLEQSYGQPYQGDDLGEVPPKPEENVDVQPLTPEQMAEQYGGEIEGELGANPKPGQQLADPQVSNLPSKEKAQLLFRTFNQLTTNGSDTIESFQKIVENFGPVIEKDQQLGRWLAKFIASKVGENVEGHYYMRFDDPLYAEDFERLKAALPANVRAILDELTR